MTVPTGEARRTLHPPPTPDFTFAPIEYPLLSRPADDVRAPDLFTNTYPLWQPPPGVAVFGGLTMGQSLHAAQQTVPTGLTPTNMHCTFHGGPDASQPVLYQVRRISDSRSYSSREVSAMQSNGRILLTAICNFSIPIRDLGNAVQYQRKIPVEQPPPPKLDEKKFSNAALRRFTERIVRSDFTFQDGVSSGRHGVDPFLWVQQKTSLPSTRSSPPSSLSGEHLPSISPSIPNSNALRTENLQSWVHVRGQLSSTVANHFPVLACLSDSWLLPAILDLQQHVAGPDMGNIKLLATLSHTIWFHEPRPKASSWMFSERRSTWAGQERLVIEELIWDEGGRLLLTCAQEGVLRLKKDRQPAGSAGASADGGGDVRNGTKVNNWDKGTSKL